MNVTELLVFFTITCRAVGDHWIFSINPRRACPARVTVYSRSVILSVCLSARVFALQATRRPMSGTNGL